MESELTCTSAVKAQNFNPIALQACRTLLRVYNTTKPSLLLTVQLVCNNVTRNQRTRAKKNKHHIRE